MRPFVAKTITGFTLIELMVTVAIAAILATLAAPSFTELMANLRVKTTAYNLISDLTLARNEAVKRGANATVAPNSSDWKNGWSVVAGTTTVSLQGSVGNGVQFISPPASIIFGKDGRVSGASTVTKFTLTDGVTRNVCISLDPAGMPKSTSRVCGS